MMPHDHTQYSRPVPARNNLTDVTSIQTQKGWVHLSTMKDLYNGFIAAHALDRNNSIALVNRTLRLARQNEKVTGQPLLHRDHIVPMSSGGSIRIAGLSSGRDPGMSFHAVHVEPGNCWDNAPMKNFFGHLKEEYLRHYRKPSFEQAQQLIDEYAHFHN